jgi:hypothetical protein
MRFSPKAFVSVLALLIPSASILFAGTVRVSVSSSGGEANQDCVAWDFTYDGRYISFGSAADNLVPSDLSPGGIFVHDRDPDENNIFDQNSGATDLVSVADDGSTDCADQHALDSSALSGNGRLVAFPSNNAYFCFNAHDSRDDYYDMILHDRDGVSVLNTPLTNTASLYPAQTNSPSISDDGTKVVFVATNLHNRADGQPIFSNDSSPVVVYENGTYHNAAVNSSGDDLSLNCPANCSTASASQPKISGNGRFVVFTSNADNLDSSIGNANHVNAVFVHDESTGDTRCMTVSTSGSQSNGSSFDPYISYSGRFVVFASAASNLITSDTNNATDIFLRDRDPDDDGIFDESDAFTIRINLKADGSPSTDIYARRPSVSEDGRFVAFEDSIPAILGTSGPIGVFIRDRDTDGNGIFDEACGVATLLVSLRADGSIPAASCYHPIISGDGKYVVFSSNDSQLVPSDTNGVADVFVTGVPDLLERTIVARQVFYDNSCYDGSGNGCTVSQCATLLGATCSDDTAIDPGKYAQLPGDGVAVFANYINYSRGLNGIAIDVSHNAATPALSSATSSMFTFTTGNVSDPTTAAPTPSNIVVSALDSTTDRIKIYWPDLGNTGALSNHQWLKVVVKSAANCGINGLAADDTFYWGLAVGEDNTPNTSTPARAVVTTVDQIDARNNPTGFTRITMSDPKSKWDYDKSSLVNTTDEVICQSNQQSLQALLLYSR